MDGKANEPLTTEAAKQQLREAASRVGIGPWVRRQPFGAMATGLLTGFVLGRMPRLVRRLTRSAVGRKMIDRIV